MATKKQRGEYYRIGIDKRKIDGKTFTFDGYVEGKLGVRVSKEHLKKQGYLVRSRQGGVIKRSYEIWKRKARR